MNYFVSIDERLEYMMESINSDYMSEGFTDIFKSKKKIQSDIDKATEKKNEAEAEIGKDLESREKIAKIRKKIGDLKERIDGRNSFIEKMEKEVEKIEDQCQSGDISGDSAGYAINEIYEWIYGAGHVVYTCTQEINELEKELDKIKDTLMADDVAKAFTQEVMKLAEEIKGYEILLSKKKNALKNLTGKVAGLRVKITAAMRKATSNMRLPKKVNDQTKPA